MPTNQRVLVTGGAGFIGAALTKLLAARGDVPFVIDDLSFGRREFAAVPDDRFFQVDVRHRADVEAALQRVQPQIVVHLAAIHFIPYCDAHPLDAISINVGGTRAVLDLLPAIADLRHVIFASTAAIYPPRSGPLAEDVPPEPMDIYGHTKLSGEDLCRSFSGTTGITTTICRLFNVFGPNETNPHLIPDIQRQVLTGSRHLRLGNLSARRDFVHSDDVARAIDHIMRRNDNRLDVFNIGSGHSYSGSDVVDAFARALRERIDVAVDPARLRAVDRPELRADIGKLRLATGWEPAIGLREGIQMLVQASDSEVDVTT